MKRIRKSACPEKLAAFAAASPLADWDQFRKKPGRYQQVARQIRKDQHNLCAYCEIDLLASQGNGLVDDFRVEHFYPKKPHNPPPNRALDWQNLLGVCHGGSERHVAQARRFTPNDYCCDANKENHDWTRFLLDPLHDIPAFPPLFEYSEGTGEMRVNPRRCPPSLHEKAQSSITLLKLNALRLREFRREVLTGLSEAIAAQLAEGQSIEQASRLVADAQFSGALPRFFTCVRWYLDQAAEDQLHQMDYQG